MLVEEIPRTNKSGSSTVYFSSSINLTARSSAFSRNNQFQAYGSPGPGQDQDQDDPNNQSNNNRSSKSRAKVNYNLNDLMNAQTQTSGSATGRSAPLKSSQQIQLEKIVTKRITDLNRETGHTSFELPKNFSYQSIHSKKSHSYDNKKSRLGNTPTTKKILAARRNLNSYFEEERNLISINSILTVNFQFIEQSETNISGPHSKRQKTSGAVIRPFKPRLKLCCICGLQSCYSRCTLCGLFSCSVRCNRLHQESRCV